MDIKVQDGKKEYIFTLRTNAKEIRLDLTGYNDENLNWSSFSEQCKPIHRRQVIDVPSEVSEQAKAQVSSILTVSNAI